MLLQQVLLKNAKSLSAQTGSWLCLRRGAEHRVTIRSAAPLRQSLVSSLWRLEVTAEREEAPPDRQQRATEKRKMEDSYCELRLPLLSDQQLRDEYAAFYGGIRLGKLLEDLDVLSATIAYAHCRGNFDEVSIVTAAVDRIDIIGPLEVANYRCAGSVTFVGQSSMEVSILVQCAAGPLESCSEGEFAAVAVAKFTAVARDAKTMQSAVRVSGLELATEQEASLFEMGRLGKERRARGTTESVFVKPPSAHESDLLHRLYLEEAAEGQFVRLHETATCSTKVCHSQERNIHNFIFGGFLMREAYDVAYACACKYAKGVGFVAVSLDEISFKRPVPIGSLMELLAKVVFSEGCAFCVFVSAEVLAASTMQRSETNTFRFTFLALGNVPKVLPHTYRDALQYLEGKRRYEGARAAKESL